MRDYRRCSCSGSAGFLDSKKKHVLLWPLLAVGWGIDALVALVLRRGYGIRVSLSADIGAGFWIGHFGGIEVINCRLAERCSVRQQTKVRRVEQMDGPQIGGSVWIGARAKILGPVKVGGQATIARRCTRDQDVPNYSLIVEDAGRIVPHRYDNSHPSADLMPPGKVVASWASPGSLRLQTPQE
jgi:serine O-acetyltransferase